MRYIDQESALRSQEDETLWYLGGQKIIEGLATHVKPTGLIFEYVYQAGTYTSSYSPAQEDTAYYIITGEVTFTCGEATMRATPGTFVFLPRPIGFRSIVTSPKPTRILTWTTPLSFAQQMTCMGEQGQPFVLAPPPTFEKQKMQHLTILLRKVNNPV